MRSFPTSDTNRGELGGCSVRLSQALGDRSHPAKWPVSNLWPTKLSIKNNLTVCFSDPTMFLDQTHHGRLQNMLDKGLSILCKQTLQISHDQFVLICRVRTMYIAQDKNPRIFPDLFHSITPISNPPANPLGVTSKNILNPATTSYIYCPDFNSRLTTGFPATILSPSGSFLHGVVGANFPRR